MEKQVLECVGKVDKLEQMVLSLTKKVDELGNRGRRSNLIVYGVKEYENETHQDLLEVVEKSIFEYNIGIKTAGIERIHRIGRKQATDSPRHRLLILKLFDYRDKANILSNCKKLKGSEDFSPRVREIRKKLWERTIVYRDQKEKVFLVRDKVKINDLLYAWDDQTDHIVEVKKTKAWATDQPLETRNRRRP